MRLTGDSCGGVEWFDFVVCFGLSGVYSALCDWLGGGSCGGVFLFDWVIGPAKRLSWGEFAGLVGVMALVVGFGV